MKSKVTSVYQIKCYRFCKFIILNVYITWMSDVIMDITVYNSVYIEVYIWIVKSYTGKTK